MPLYLLQVAYNNDGWAALVKNPHDRSEAVRPAIEQLGGRIESFYYAFGESDVVAVVRMPDNVSAAAFSMAVAGGPTVKSIRTTPLMTTQEGVEAMRKAGGSSYRPAGASRARTRAATGRQTRRK
jgi:uncharacterized protein with GYD domain